MVLVCLSLGPTTATGGVDRSEKRGLAYWGSDPYAALPEARRLRKPLLVEFYADWNHRCRWMSERVLGDSSVRALVEQHFVAVRVPTATADGAALAALYEVTDYPAIVIFNANGEVIDKIDTTLDAEDFEQRIRAILMAVRGTGTWRLRVVYAAAEMSDPAATDAAVEQFLAGQEPLEVANSAVWPMFENSVVMRYGSTAFDYLVGHVELFRREVGTDRVDELLNETLRRSMLPYVVGSVPYDRRAADGMTALAERLGLSAALALRSMAEVARLREEDDLALFVARLGLLLDLLPETYHLPLVLSLEPVAERGADKSKKRALELLNRVRLSIASRANEALLLRLADRLK